MNRIFFIIFLCPLFSFSQERVDSKLPEIIDTVASLKNAKGWMKNNIGKWVSKQNAIPSDHNDYNWNCYEFIEFSLLKVSYKGVLYFCLAHKNEGELNFFIFNYFENRELGKEDTLIHLVFDVIHEGALYEPKVNSLAQIHEMYKKFEDKLPYNLTDKIEVDLYINRSQNYLRFFIIDKYLAFCGKEENALERKYFESSLANLFFFEALFPE